MDFDAAITAHIEWKLKLRLYLKNKENRLEPSVVCKDNLCQLGKWLYGEGVAKYSGLPQFQELVSVHREFHKVAGDIVSRANAGEDVEEEVVLGVDSPYDRTSIRLTQLLMQLSQSAA